MLFGEFKDQYFDYKKLYNKTSEQERKKTDFHFKHLFSKKLNKISFDDARELQVSLFEQNKSPKTINNILSILFSMLNYAVKKSLIEKNPLVGLEKLKVNNKRQRFLNTDEIILLLKELENAFEYKLFVLIALNTGARFQSIMDLKRKNIYLHDKIIIIEDQKKDASYQTFINKILFDKLIKIKDFKPNELIFKTNRRTLQNNLLKILDDLFNADLDKNDRKNRAVIHTLRHTFASQLAIEGTPIATIQKLLNHKDIASTMRYAKLSPNSGRDEVENLGKIFSQKSA